jgi:hypothetical protein
MAANSPSNGRREAVTTLPSDTIAYDDNRDKEDVEKSEPESITALFERPRGGTFAATARLC